jgi:RimJ/RimL family protein N-acetyltransferase
MTVIQTPRLELREHTPAVLERLYAIFSDPVTMRFWPAPYTLEKTTGWIERAITSYTDNGFGRWGVYLRASDELIGDCGFFDTTIDGTREIDLGYIIHASQWRREYGFEAAEACLRYGFDRFGMKRICANMVADHAASRRVAEKLGMTLEREFVNAKNRNLRSCLYAIHSGA